MTQTNFDLIFLALLLLGMITFAAARNIIMLSTANAICMTCAPLLGQSVVLLGYPNDCAAIFFTITMFGLSLEFLVHGAAEAYRGIKHIVFAMLIVFTSIFVLQNAELLNPLFGARIQVAGARLIVFCLTQPLFIYMLQRPSRLSPLLRVPMLAAAMLIIDGLVFLPCAFIGLMPIDFIWRFTLYCIALRLFVSTLSIPFLFFILYLKHHGFLEHFVSKDGRGTYP